MASFIEQLRKDGLEEQQREVKIQVESVDVEKREAEFSFSSEYEVHRYWGVEILGHEPEEVDLTRLNNGGAFLNMHNPWDQRGVVLKAWLGDDKRCHCRVRISRSEAGEELLNDMADGIRTQVSVGYRIIEAVLIKQEDGVEFYRVIKWEPTEVSSVSIAADPTVGAGRSDTQPHQAAPKVRYPINIQRGESAMPQEQEPEFEVQEPNTPSAQTRAAAPVQPAVDASGLRGEMSDAQKIAKTAKEYGAAELGQTFISEGRSYGDFNDALLKKLNEKRNDPAAQSTALDLDLPESDLKRYRLMNVIRGLASNDLKKFAPHELAVSEAMAERMGKDASGIHVPYEVLGHGLRQQAAGVATKGAELVATELHSDAFIEALRQQSMMGRLGARLMTGLVGNVDIPKQVGTATFYWVGEDGEPTDSDLTFGTVQMSPRTLAAAVPMTRRLAKQSSLDVESMIRADLLKGVAEGIDNDILATILDASGVGAVDLTGGPTWAKICEFEGDVEEANAAADGMAYLMRPTIKQLLKTTPKVAGTAEFLMQNGEVNGYPGYGTTQMPVNNILFGDYSQAMGGLWGSVDLVVDKAEKSKSGGLVLRVFQDADSCVRHEGAFSHGVIS